jgi:hypothetical protein
MKEREEKAKNAKGAAQSRPDAKKRLADALRRNLAKRKDTKEAKIVDNPDGD